MLDEMFDAFESFQNLEKKKKEERNHVGLCWMKFALDQTFHQTFSGSSIILPFNTVLRAKHLQWSIF